MRDRIEAEALRIGFTACGFAHAEPVEEEAVQVLDRWTEQGYHAEMGYMERNRELRIDPTLLVPGCRTLIVVGLNYYPQRLLPKEGYQIAYYAYGADYHRVVKDKLYQLLAYIRTLVPDVKGRQGLLKVGPNTAIIQITPTQKEFEFVETNPNKVAARQKED